MASFEGASDAEIISRSERELNDMARTSNQSSGSTSVDESGVDDGAVSRFPKTEGLPQVSVGRTGQTGGGENAQLIPPEEGGEGKVGLSSDIYDQAADKDELRSKLAGANPGGVNLAGDDITDASTKRHEAIRSNDFTGEQQLQSQSDNPYDQ